MTTFIKTNTHLARINPRRPHTSLKRVEEYEEMMELATELRTAVTIAIQNATVRNRKMEASRAKNPMTIRDRINHNDKSILHRFFIGNVPVFVYATRHVNERLKERSVKKEDVIQSLEECHKYMEGTLIDKYERYTESQQNRGYEFAIKNKKLNMSVAGAVYSEGPTAKIIITTVLHHANFFHKDYVEPITIA